MKRILAVAAILSVTACAEPEAEDAMAEEEVAVETNGIPGGAGTYEVTYSDGSVGTMTASEDGTFTASMGENSGGGTITEVDGKICFDADGDEEGATCWTNSEVAEDGSWTSTSDDGEVVSVKPAAAEEEAAEEAAE